jgi:hypothetical protein
MVPTVTLWLPILVSAVVVFVASSVIHMVLGYHAGDVKALPKEDETMAALRKFAIPPGDYAMPRAGSMKRCGHPRSSKLKAGPVVFMTVGRAASSDDREPGPLVRLFAVRGSVRGVHRRSRPRSGASYLAVFRFAGRRRSARARGLVRQSIWYDRSWAAFKSVLDGLICLPHRRRVRLALAAVEAWRHGASAALVGVALLLVVAVVAFVQRTHEELLDFEVW